MCVSLSARRLLRLSAVALLALAAILPTVGCAIGSPARASLNADVRTPDPSVIVFLADGLDPDVVRRGVAHGKLPNIQKYFVEGGTEVENAVTCVPSITYAVLATAFTGVSPAEHGITGIWWFDRRERLFRNYATIKHYRDIDHDLELPTVFERIEPHPSVNVQNALTRGVTTNYPNWANSGLRWLIKRYIGVDKLTSSTFEKIINQANAVGEWPALTVLYAPGPDAVAHRHGPDSRQYRHAVKHYDHQLGRVCQWLEREEMLERVVLVLISDHGVVEVKHRIDLMHALKDDYGLRVTDRIMQDEPLANRTAFYDRFEAVAVYHSGRRAALHIAGPDGWDSAPSYEAVSDVLERPAPGRHIWDHEGIQLVAYLGSENEVVLRSPRGMARIEERDGSNGREFRYAPAPDDVLGYLDDDRLAQFVAAGFHGERDWLEATADQQIPDVVANLGPLLRVSRGGQVLAFPKPGYAFVKQHGGHGGVDRDEMITTFYVRGPGFAPGGRIAAARVRDLTPTILSVLHKTPIEDTVVAGLSLPTEQEQAAAYGK